MAKPKRKPGEQADALLGDLESIRTLLAEDEQEQEIETNVPLLEDVIHGGVEVDDDFLNDSSGFRPTAEEFPGLDEKTVKALMGDDWRAMTRRIMQEARDTVGDYHEELKAAPSEALSEALRDRLGATVEQWLQQLVADNIEELRAQVFNALADELRHLVEEGDSGR